MELNFEGLKTQKWNITTEKAQRDDEKSGVICLVFMFTPKINVKNGSFFCIFCYWQQKISHNLGKIFKCIWKILISSFRKYYGLLDSELLLARFQPLNIKSFGIFLLTQRFFYISTLNISQTVTLKPIKHTIFWKNSIRPFRCT